MYIPVAISLRQQDYGAEVQIFATMLSDQPTLDLLDGLEKSYLGVPYGECYVGYDGDAVQLFMKRTEELLDDLYVRTQVKFLPKHYDVAQKRTVK